MRLYVRIAVCVVFMIVFSAVSGITAELELESPELVSYDFDESPVEINVMLSGSDAILQLVVVESLDWDVPPWKQDEVLSPEERFAQGLDPLVSVVPQIHCQEGPYAIPWDGKDMDGKFITPGYYRFYVLAFAEGVLPDSLDYDIENRSEILENTLAVTTGKITGNDMQPEYMPEHFTDIAASPVYAKISPGPQFGSSVGEPFSNGDEIGVFSPRGDLVGVYLHYSRIMAAPSFNVYGDNPATPETDGMQDGEPMTFVIWDYQTGTELPAEAVFATGNPLYEDGARYTLESISVTYGAVVTDNLPEPFVLYQNSPNPANPVTAIRFMLPEAASVTLDVYNSAGQKIETLIDCSMNAGEHAAVWNGSGYSSGVYFYTVKAGEYSKTMKMVLMR